MPTRGLKAAIAKVLNATWQRCRVHFMRNALAHAGKSGRRVVSAFVATAFAQNDAQSARQQWRRVADQLRPKVPKLAALMDEAEPDVLAYMTFPQQHRAKLDTSKNPDWSVRDERCGALSVVWQGLWALVVAGIVDRGLTGVRRARGW